MTIKTIRTSRKGSLASPDRKSARIRCLSGELWITWRGSADHILKADEELILPAGRKRPRGLLMGSGSAGKAEIVRIHQKGKAKKSFEGEKVLIEFSP